MTYCTRAEAADRLAERLRAWRPDAPVLVALAPRGVEIAVGLAERLGWPLDAVLVHEVNLPGYPTGILGAVGEHGVRHLNMQLATRLGIGADTLERQARQSEAALMSFRTALRARLPEQPLAGRTVLLVDDGVATGAAAAVGVVILREREADPVVLAVPVGARGSLGHLRAVADSLACVHEMPWPRPVCEWYDRYSEITDKQAMHHLVCAVCGMTTSGPDPLPPLPSPGPNPIPPPGPDRPPEPADPPPQRPPGPDQPPVPPEPTPGPAPMPEPLPS